VAVAVAEGVALPEAVRVEDKVVEAVLDKVGVTVSVMVWVRE
jgi:hypothetical protein